MLENLNEFTGTQNYYRHTLGWFFYTDGIQYVAEQAGAYWLIDLIASYQPQLRKVKDTRLHEMQFWHLKVNADKSAVATCIADTGEEPAITQHIEYSDFPLSEIDIWVCSNGNDMVAMLKTEY